MSMTADEHRAAADSLLAAREESYERCDTDGFLSQWAQGLSAQVHRLQAEIEERGGRAKFRALFDMEGNLVPAKLGHNRYGSFFGLMDPDLQNDRFIAFFNPSQAATPAKRYAANARKGYRLGWVLAPAKAEVKGGGTGLGGAASCYAGVTRKDGGFSADAEIVSIDTPESDWQD